MPPEARTIRSRTSRGTASPTSTSASSSGSGSSRSVAGQPGRRSSSSGRAMQTSRSGAPVESSAVDSTRSRNVSSPHWMSSKQTTSGACSSSSFRNAHAISSVPATVSLSPSSDRIAVAAASSLGQRVELLHHLDDRPVGDPLAVGEATAAHDPRVDPRERLRDEPRLADARIAHDRDELATRGRRARCPRRRRAAAAPARGRRTRDACKRSAASRTATSGWAATGSLLPFSSSSRSSPTSTAGPTSASVRRRSAPRPAPPPARAAPPRSPRPRSRAAPRCPSAPRRC